ncbi:hypothetical protein DC31_11100 [Microbacterium sp. CH12i]|uniref:hypothetical protein n=1 Tax=Microbacterium sp. CH12i TaxID=1479651 RepID=UPI00046115F0|nr:hypothetical protein [Microbacterium sp. CH12i]KDA06395.1 hypothetical protein DC31_11100 [Microbacterium sp. CH12i]
MSFNTPELAQPVPAVKAASQPAISKGLMIATIILTSLTAIGLFATLILLFATATNSDNEAFAGISDSQ